MSNEKVDWVTALLRSIMRVRFPQTAAPLAALIPREPFGARRFGTQRRYIRFSVFETELVVVG